MDHRLCDGLRCPHLGLFLPEVSILFDYLMSLSGHNARVFF